jgi:hypothetical protein
MQRRIYLSGWDDDYLKQMVWQSEDGFNLSSRGPVYKGSGDHCAHAGIQEGFSQGAWIGNENAELLHKPGGQKSEPFSKSGSQGSKGIVFRADQSIPETRRLKSASGINWFSGGIGVCQGEKLCRNRE